jgi:RNA-directed DNA polymerase
MGNLKRAWAVIQNNGRLSSSDVVKEEIGMFAEKVTSNLRSLQTKLSRKNFKFAKARGVPIPKIDGHGKKTGKIRPIVLATVESRVVQRAILNVLTGLPALESIVMTPYSFGGIQLRRRLNDGTSRSEDMASPVSTAIKAVLAEIGNGAKYCANADIKNFFTRISKNDVTNIIEKFVKDEEFLELLRRAINVDLSNLAQLGEKASYFPTGDLGVAQGNCLSPLLGNIILADFDRVMNEGDCKCIRYIDDFIILAPSKEAVEARLKKAKWVLNKLQMELSPEKSSKAGIPIENGFDFLGINICQGAIRPSSRARTKILESVEGQFSESLKAMRAVRHGEQIDKKYSLINTLKRVDGVINGWGKHYGFCNDHQFFENLDKNLDDRVRRYLGGYAVVREEVPMKFRRKILGVAELAEIPRTPLSYPKTSKRRR